MKVMGTVKNKVKKMLAGLGFEKINKWDAPYSIDTLQPNRLLEGKSCVLCGGSNYLTYHHLVPRSMGGKGYERMPMCVDCHTYLHKNFSNDMLMTTLDTVEKLKANYRVQLFLNRNK